MALRWDDSAKQRIAEAGVRGLNMGAEALLGYSDERVPVDTTDLRNSGAVHQASIGSPESGVYYNTPYAVIQHERTDFHHPTDFNPGAQAKYLESALVENAAALSQVVAAQIRRVL